MRWHLQNGRLLVRGGRFCTTCCGSNEEEPAPITCPVDLPTAYGFSFTYEVSGCGAGWGFTGGPWAKSGVLTAVPNSPCHWRWDGIFAGDWHIVEVDLRLDAGVWKLGAINHLSCGALATRSTGETPIGAWPDGGSDCCAFADNRTQMTGIVLT